MRDREFAQSSRTLEHKHGPGRLVLGDAAPPLLQAVTLTTNLSGAGKLRPKTTASTQAGDADQSFGSRALQVIKASHTATAGTAGHSSGRTSETTSARTALLAPQHLNASIHTRQNHLQDIKAWRHSRVLQDAGLQVSPAKVNRRQSLDNTNAQSPYSGRNADGDMPSKRKSIARSASFASGSHEAATRRRHSTAALSSGSRPGSAPASGSQALLATPDKQPAQRRQLAGSQHAPDAPVFTLPGFRAGSCLSADTRLGRLKQVQRPGTPNVRAEGTSSVLRSTSAAVAAFERLHKKAPIRQQLSVSAGSAAAAAYKTAAAIGHQPVTVRNAADKTVGSSRAGINSDGSVSIDLSDSDDSSWSLLNSDSSAESCSNSASDDRELQQESKVQLSYTPGAVSKRRLQITEALQHSQPNGSLSMHLTQQRQQKDAGLVTAGSMASNTCEAAGHADEASGSHSHIGGNTVLSCTSGRSHSVQLPLQSRAQHALMLQSKEVMHWLGMDDAWFEETFLPLAEKHCIVLPN